MRAGLTSLLQRGSGDEPSTSESDSIDSESDFETDSRLSDKKLGKGIYFRVSDGGKNLSDGERQLICICRAILRKKKIIILDEATANIDIVTEEVIQRLIKEEF